MNQKERWQTPPEVFDPLNAEFSFDLDAAADEQTTRCKRFLKNALGTGDWPGKRIWLNPPYGNMIAPFIYRAFKEQQAGKTIVALIPFRCRAAWWHDCVIGWAREVRCIRQRVKFLKLDGARGDFTGSCDSCIVIWDGIARPQTVLTGFMQGKKTG